MEHLSPMQFQRLQQVLQSGILRHVAPEDEPPLRFNVESAARALTIAADGSHATMTPLGLLSLAASAQLMEDAVLILGYILEGELLMVTHLESDYMQVVGVKERLAVSARITKRQKRLLSLEVQIAADGGTVASARITALVIRTLPESVQRKIVAGAQAGVVHAQTLREFIHLFAPHHFVAAMQALVAAEVAAP